MKKKLFAITVITVMGLCASINIDAFAKSPISQSQAEEPQNDNQAGDLDDLPTIHGTSPDSSGPIPTNSESYNTHPLSSEEEEAKRIEKEEASSNSNSRSFGYFVDGDAIITFNNVGIGQIPKSTASKEGDLFYWKDTSGNIWRFYSIPEGPLLDDEGFHPELFRQYHGEECNDRTWQQYFNAHKIGKITPGSVDESMQ